MYMEAGDAVPPPAPSVPAAGGELPPLVPALDLQQVQRTRLGSGQQGMPPVHGVSGGSKGRVVCLESASRECQRGSKQ